MELRQQTSRIVKKVKPDPANSRPRQFPDVSALEAEIDRLVYSLYGLAREEIAIIEESLQERTGNRAAAGALAVKEDR